MFTHLITMKVPLINCIGRNYSAGDNSSASQFSRRINNFNLTSLTLTAKKFYYVTKAVLPGGVIAVAEDARIH